MWLSCHKRCDQESWKSSLNFGRPPQGSEGFSCKPSRASQDSQFCRTADCASSRLVATPLFWTMVEGPEIAGRNQFQTTWLPASVPRPGRGGGGAAWGIPELCSHTSEQCLRLKMPPMGGYVRCKPPVWEPGMPDRRMIPRRPRRFPASGAASKRPWAPEAGSVSV